MPRNISAETDVQPAKSDGEPDIAPFRRRQSGGDPGRHEAGPDGANHRHTEHPTGQHARYNNNHVGAMTAKSRSIHSLYVIAAPATNGAAIANPNLRALASVSLIPARCAFLIIAISSTTTATDAATSHVASHRSAVGCVAATFAAASPTTPTTTPPTPGTAANLEDRSIAERINVSSSAAWLLTERGRGSGVTRGV